MGLAQLDDLELVGIWWSLMACLAGGWSVEEALNGQSRFLLHPKQDMRIDIHRDRNTGMIEAFADYLWVYPGA